MAKCKALTGSAVKGLMKPYCCDVERLVTSSVLKDDDRCSLKEGNGREGNRTGREGTCLENFSLE